jgi:hypothetical protein
MAPGAGGRLTSQATVRAAPSGDNDTEHSPASNPSRSENTPVSLNLTSFLFDSGTSHMPALGRFRAAQAPRILRHTMRFGKEGACVRARKPAARSTGWGEKDETRSLSRTGSSIPWLVLCHLPRGKLNYSTSLMRPSVCPPWKSLETGMPMHLTMVCQTLPIFLSFLTTCPWCLRPSPDPPHSITGRLSLP